MLQGMTVHEFRRWRAYYDLEPFGEERADFRAASIVQTLVAIHRKRGTKVKPIRDFVLKWGDDAAGAGRKTWQQMKAIGAMIAGKTSAGNDEG